MRELSNPAEARIEKSLEEEYQYLMKSTVKKDVWDVNDIEIAENTLLLSNKVQRT